MKKLIYIIGGILVVLLAALVILPFVIDANTFRPEIERLLGEQLNRKVTIGNIQLSILSGGVAVGDLTIADDPAFSREAFLTAKAVTVGVEMGPLIFSRRLRVTGLTIDQPQATLLRTGAGVWNFSTLGASPSGTKPASQQAAAAAAASGGDMAQGLAIQQFRLRNGTVNVGTVGARGKTHTYNQVNLTASNLSYTSQFPFELTLATPGSGSISLQGQAGPLNQTDMQKTPLNAALEAKNLDLGATGFVEPGSGLAGVVDFSGALNSDGKQVITKGTATASKLQLVPGGSPAGQPVQLAYQTDYQLAGRNGVLRQGDVRVGQALAQLTGTYRTQGETTSVQMKLRGKNMPVTDVSSLLPALGVILPAGAALQEGTLDLDMNISGPVDRLVTSGPVNLSNAKMTGFDLGSKMKALATFAGIPNTSDTLIQTLASDLRLDPAGIRADNFTLIVPAIGNLSGNGTISPKQELNFKMTAKLAAAASSTGALGALSRLTGGQQGGGIPFRIQGTTSSPVFVPDVAGIASGLAGQTTTGDKPAIPGGKSLGEALGGLLGRSKQ
jgi:AsmA protein